MTRILITRDIAMACAMDAANRQMRAAGRKAWSIEDIRLGFAIMDRLWPADANDMVVEDADSCTPTTIPNSTKGT